MENSTLIWFGVVTLGGVLSLVVWFGGYLFRRRLRGVARMMMMTFFLVLWYYLLLPLTDSRDYPTWARPVHLAIHSIWVWWAIAMARIEMHARKQARRSDWTTGLYHATGVHIVNKEITKIRERRKAATAERQREKPATDGDLPPAADSQTLPRS